MKAVVKPLLPSCLLPVIIFAAVDCGAYPVDGYETTQMRRLQALNPATLPAGARLPAAEVLPSGGGVAEIPRPDPDLSSRLAEILGDEADLYSIAVLDLSDPEAPLFGVHNADVVANVGSVGKILVLYALFDQLARLYPSDTEARGTLLRETVVTADEWVNSDYHVVPIYDPSEGRVVSRRLAPGDRGNLWEYLDWMLSASSNSAASVVVQQVILLERYGLDYPRPAGAHQAFIESSSAGELGRLWLAAMERPLKAAGFDLRRLRQGGPFTATASGRVHGTTSVGNVTDLVRLINLVESNRFVDAWSSREAKRLLYMTQKRIRYASHPVLNDAAVYFKSGSFYSCEPEPGFTCRQYMGNRVNRLASVVLVEAPAGEPALRYLVAVMSNVLRVNSAVAHQTLALRIHRAIEALNRERPPGRGAAGAK